MSRLLLAAVLLQIIGLCGAWTEANNFAALYLAVSAATTFLCWFQLRHYELIKRFTFQRIIERKVRLRTSELQHLLTQYEKAATTDPLTGLLNRRGGEDAIMANIARAQRTCHPVSFLMLDVDHFKKVNDAHGHGFGDEVLCAIGRAATSVLRISDFAIRWGGEEVLLVLPDTNLEGALRVAEKVRVAVEVLEFDREVSVTASIGAAEASRGEEFHTTIARADMHLYIAKASGRNCIVPRGREKTS